MERLIVTSVLIFLSLMGKAQYNYLGDFDEQGFPFYLDGNTEIDESLFANVSASLPEGKPVPTYNPHLISSGYDNDIYVRDSAEIWVTFVEEGAGYKNVLGFYTYDSKKPPKDAPEDEDITIIFPNFSAAGSGGSLTPGDRVKIGAFPPDTGIGWVLMANGFKNGQVTEGNWVLFSNQDYNPEKKKKERYHNVQLLDEESELILIGFEDIRRDDPSCDQDFNDAIFYVTANPMEALKTENMAPVVKSEKVSSGNDGGLESNGDLAVAIARRNLERTRSHNTHHLKSGQARISRFKAARTTSLSDFMPETDFTGTEEGRVSSPEDLIALTNALEVFAIDYYKGEDRTSAALVVKTENNVYNHSKNVCDRLNGGIVRDMRYVDLDSVNLLYAEVTNPEGSTEFVTWFSVIDEGEHYSVSSLWNVGDYPEGNYTNIQVWGSTPATVFHKADYALQKFAEDKPVYTAHGQDMPSVYVKSGFYKEGVLHLTLNNELGLSSVQLEANVRRTEQSVEELISQTIVLSGELHQQVSIHTGHLFDAGISLSTIESDFTDNLYLADGAWGVDFTTEDSEVEEFIVFPDDSAYVVGEHSFLVERSFAVSGESAGVVNIFKNLMPANRMLNIETFNTVSFDLESNVALEVVLVPKDLDDWNNRPKVIVQPRNSQETVNLSLGQFGLSDKTKYSEIQAILFSYVNASGEKEAFSFHVENIVFSPDITLDVPDAPSLAISEMSVYPNPSFGSSVLEVLVHSAEAYHLSMYDFNGALVHHEEGVLASGSNRFTISQDSLEDGIYLLKLGLASGEHHVHRLIFR